jgi:uncharacterized protein (DUF1684 family)
MTVTPKTDTLKGRKSLHTDSNKMTAVSARTALDVADWRRCVFTMYDLVRNTEDPSLGHALWRCERDDLFAHHPSSPLVQTDLQTFTSLPIAPYDPTWRFELPVLPAEKPSRFHFSTGTDGIVPFDLIGIVDVPGVGSLDVWRLTSYGGGIFLPVRDALAGQKGGTYAGGRYLLDTVKGADLGKGSVPGSLILDFNFAYNPSCAYDPAWACPLAPPGNRVNVEIPVGERYNGSH